MKKYMVVPGPTNVVVGEKESVQSAMDLFASIINEHTKSGWEYHSMESIIVSNKPGCGSKDPKMTNYYMLIFVKEADL